MMGVSISWTPLAQEYDVTPGARSDAATLLRDNGLVGDLDAASVPMMVRLAAEAGSNDLRKMLMTLVTAIEKHGTIIVRLNY